MVLLVIFYHIVILINYLRYIYKIDHYYFNNVYYIFINLNYLIIIYIMYIIKFYFRQYIFFIIFIFYYHDQCIQI